MMQKCSLWHTQCGGGAQSEDILELGADTAGPLEPTGRNEEDQTGG